MTERTCRVVEYDADEKPGPVCGEPGTVEIPTHFYGRLEFLYQCPRHAETFKEFRVDPTEARFSGQPGFRG